MNFGNKKVAVIGGGLAGSECALQLADRGFFVHLFDMKPERFSAAHSSEHFAELVCSNSFKSLKPASAAGMLKRELGVLASHLYKIALETKVEAGGALAVDREKFAESVTKQISSHPNIRVISKEIKSLSEILECEDDSLSEEACEVGSSNDDVESKSSKYDAIVIATGPLTSEDLCRDIIATTGMNTCSFYDAAAPIVMADSIERNVAFCQNRYDNKAELSCEGTDSLEGQKCGDYINCPFNKGQYYKFIDDLVGARKVELKDFESTDLFSGCQPKEEIARTGVDAPRFGPMKPVGITDPRTGQRPWAVVQLRSENKEQTCYNLVGFQTNLAFDEQKRVFRMIPGLERAEFARFGVMHKNTFLNAPKVAKSTFEIPKLTEKLGTPTFVAGQLIGTEGYLESVRGGLHVALCVSARLLNSEVATKELIPPKTTVFGALIDYATSRDTLDYQPMHVNFGIIEPLEKPIKKKTLRYEQYAEVGERAICDYKSTLEKFGLI